MWKSIEKLFPDIINNTEEILKEHGFSADSKRRTDTVRSSGVTLEQIKDELLYGIPLLKDHVLHETTIHRLLSSLNKRFKASTSYKSEVDAKVPPKSTMTELKMKMLTCMLLGSNTQRSLQVNLKKNVYHCHVITRIRYIKGHKLYVDIINCKQFTQQMIY